MSNELMAIQICVMKGSEESIMEQLSRSWPDGQAVHNYHARATAPKLYKKTLIVKDTDIFTRNLLKAILEDSECPHNKS